MAKTVLNKIDAYSKSVREILSNAKYSIDYYQREYKWQTKHIDELLDDLEGRFLQSYETGHDRAEVRNYAYYFLGSIVISQKNGQSFIIDGQQRLTSLTLLLIYLNNLQQGRRDQVDVKNLIFSERYGQKSFNLDVPERQDCIDALYGNREYDATGEPESVRNIVARYANIGESFPDTLKGDALPYFIDWLLDNLHIAQIVAYSDDDAYTIFETMNDRGLSLSPTEMLKGYLLANITAPEEKAHANALWKARILEMVGVAKEDETDFFKAWLRAKYADSIRERKKGASNRDFERIGTTFNKWVREEKSKLGLIKSADFRDFMEVKFNRFSNHYITARRAAMQYTPGLEYLFYNSLNDFTLQYPLVLAPVLPEDDSDIARTKMRLVAGYIDILIARRMVNFRTLSYSSIVYGMFTLMKEIRDLDVQTLSVTLRAKVGQMEEKFDGVTEFAMHQMNRRHVHYLLARLTHHVEQKCGIASDFTKYISRDIDKPYEVEHIWANRPSNHKNEFPSEVDFANYRNRMGGLLLLPRDFNQSFGDAPYEKKVKAYFGQNILAKSLNEQCYQNNPSFLSYSQESGLPFRPYQTEFTKAALEERQDLYRKICEEVWSAERFGQL